ncbi:MAG TPA: glycosyltransferase family 4 protein [Chthoniobacterales bacterium]|jgi:glycosyltransferase involved in cell wall biosynthesis
MELADQWRALGHQVSHFSLSEAFPASRASGVRFALQQLSFARKVAAFIRRKKDSFDIIDATIGCLPYSRKALGFRGIVVARSVGLYLLYERFERVTIRRWPRHSRGTVAGRLFYGFVRRSLMRACDSSVKAADVINVPNESEATCLSESLDFRGRIIVQPYGLSDSCRHLLSQQDRSAEERLAERRVCFIGMWSPRKGSYDWPRIIRAVRSQIPEVRFRFLGTMTDATTVRKDLGSASEEKLEFVSHFKREDLLSLLVDCTVGAFPSYVEGFGLAVLEQLAAGLPTVAYDIPGPRDILRRTLPDLLVPCGDTEKFAATLCQVLALSAGDYRVLSRKSVETTGAFSWETIALDTLGEYEPLLDCSVATQTRGTGHSRD